MSEAEFVIAKWAKRRGWTVEQQLAAVLYFIEFDFGMDFVEMLDRSLALQPPPTPKPLVPRSKAG